MPVFSLSHPPFLLLSLFSFFFLFFLTFTKNKKKDKKTHISLNLRDTTLKSEVVDFLKKKHKEIQGLLEDKFLPLVRRWVRYEGEGREGRGSERREGCKGFFVIYYDIYFFVFLNLLKLYVYHNILFQILTI